MIVEMRVYHCAPGRLPALNERFSKATLGFFEKHGIRPIGFWTTLVDRAITPSPTCSNGRVSPSGSRSGTRSRRTRTG